MRPPRRQAYTILELVAVLAVVIILSSVLVPAINSYYSNTRQKSTADLIRSRIVEARAKAMEQGVWYRVAINQDKTRIRVGPDGPDFSSLKPGDSDAPNTKVTEDKFEEKVTAEVTTDPDNSALGEQSGGQSSNGQSSGSSQSSNGSVLTNGGTAVDGEWITVITVGPEGICKEDFSTVTVKEAKFQPLLVQVRGIVGSAGIITAPNNSNSKGGGK
jgi:Tfp pilus assembly protein FimT